MGDTAPKEQSWKLIASAKQRQRDARIRPEWMIDPIHYRGRRNVLDVPSTCGVLSSKELKITSDYDAVDIVERMRDGVYTVEEVVTAFCKRAAVAQQVVRFFLTL